MIEVHFVRTFCLSALAAIAGATVPCEAALAARLLQATVEVDGQLVLQTSYTDSGAEKRETVWRYFGKEPGWAETAKIQPDEADPQRAHLKGNIVIRIQHVDRPIVQANVSELELMRIGSPGDRWFLPESEVERIAAASGIPAPPALRSSDGGLLIALLAGLATMAMIGGLLVWAVWTRKPAAPRAAGE
jgi:hypothetical protein